MASITQINVNGTTYDLKDNISGYTTAYDGTTTSDTKYDALFLETVGSGVDTVKVGLDIDLLWTNSAPTSNFAPQTVLLDLSTYTMVYITFKWQTSSADPYYSQITKVGCNGNVSVKETNNIYRTWEVSTTGIAFNKGRYATTTGSASDNNSYAIPYQIYGIK